MNQNNPKKPSPFPSPPPSTPSNEDTPLPPEEDPSSKENIIRKDPPQKDQPKSYEV